MRAQTSTPHPTTGPRRSPSPRLRATSRYWSCYCATSACTSKAARDIRGRRQHSIYPPGRASWTSSSSSSPLAAWRLSGARSRHTPRTAGGLAESAPRQRILLKHLALCCSLPLLCLVLWCSGAAAAGAAAREPGRVFACREQPAKPAHAAVTCGCCRRSAAPGMPRHRAPALLELGSTGCASARCHCESPPPATQPQRAPRPALLLPSGSRGCRLQQEQEQQH